MTGQQDYDLQIVIASGPEALARAALNDTDAVVRLCSACAVGNCATVTAGNDHRGERPYIGLTEVAIRAASGSARTVVF